MLLQLVFAVADVPDPQDHHFGVASGQAPAPQQYPAERRPRPEQPPVLGEHREQMDLRNAPNTGGDLAEQRAEQAKLAATAGRNPGRRWRGQPIWSVCGKGRVDHVTIFSPGRALVRSWGQKPEVSLEGED